MLFGKELRVYVGIWDVGRYLLERRKFQLIIKRKNTLMCEVPNSYKLFLGGTHTMSLCDIRGWNGTLSALYQV